MTAIDSSHSATSSSGSIATRSTLLGTIAAYLTASDHKRIGRLLISVSAIFAIATAIEGAILGIERISPSSSIVDADIIVQLFSALRFDLIFSVAAPMMLGLAVAVVPMQVGARALAFARSAMFGFYLWLFGVILVGSSYLNNGGPGGGNAEMVDLFLIGLGLVIAGLLLISTSVATTVLASRRAGMTLIETPIFSWSALVASVSMLLTLPVVAGAIIYVAVDHAYERATFGATEGVNAWIGWAFTTPNIYCCDSNSWCARSDCCNHDSRQTTASCRSLDRRWSDVDRGYRCGHTVITDGQFLGQRKRRSQIADPVSLFQSSADTRSFHRARVEFVGPQK